LIFLGVVYSFGRLLIKCAFDYIGPARLRLNMLEVASELKRVWHPWFKVLFVIRCDTCSLWAFLTVRTVSSQWR